MPKYFKFIGTIEIIFAVIGFFYFAFNLSLLQTIIPIGNQGASTGFTFAGFLTLVIYAVFAPAFGLFLIGFREILGRVRNIGCSHSLELQEETKESKNL